MVERARPTASVARYGFTDPRADGQLRAAGWWTESGPDGSAADVLSALSRAADPDLALSGLDRIREADPAAWDELDQALRTNRTFRGRMLGVLGTSSALADFLVANTDCWKTLQGDKNTETL